MIYGGQAGGGKSWGLLLEPLRHIDNPDFGAVIFRRTSPMITNEGGLWDESSKLYPLIGGKPFQSSPPYWTFSSGANVSFAHLQHNKNVLDWQGSQIPLICFDELTHFTEYQFFYMMSRNRSMCGVKPYIRATTNPDSDSFVAKLIAWWIDPETGYAIPERSGVIRWFYRIANQLHWYDSREEARAAHPELATGDPLTDVDPKSLTFIMARLDDNQKLLQADPAYRANLLALPLVERERLLAGNWKIRNVAGNVFRAEWLPIVDVRLPRELKRVRYWDKAGTQDDGDWTVGVLMALGADAIYVEDVIRAQLGPFERNKLIKHTTMKDAQRYENYTVWGEMEGGSGGKESALITIRDLAGVGVFMEKVTGEKIVRAKPFASQCEGGFVRLVKGDWNDAYVDELVSFPEGLHDDQVDGSSGAFAKLVILGSPTVTHY